MGYRYGVVGAGRQGTAAAYDMVRHGEADEVVLIDLDPARSRGAAARVNRLTKRRLARSAVADVRKPSAVARSLEGADVFLSAVPYFFNLDLARLAIDEGISMVDLGGNTDIVRREQALDARARRAGVALVPDCGMGPGFNITLTVYAMGLLDHPRDVYGYEGGLPQDPRPPWNYELTFNIEGLTNEYDGKAVFLRDSKIVEVPALEEPEDLEIPPVGRLEAFTTSGSLSTAPWTFLGKVRTLQSKCLRYPGHWAKLRAFADLGLFGTKAVAVDGRPVVPRHLFHRLMEPQVTPRDIRDVCIMRTRVLGTQGGDEVEVLVDMVDRYDPTTGFTSMERITGWHAAIVAEMIAMGEIPPGAHPVEVGVPAGAFVKAARHRGIAIREQVRALS